MMLTSTTNCREQALVDQHPSSSHSALCVSLQLGAIEAQRFRLRPESEACDRGDSPTLNDPRDLIGA
jgi:hypothetical protein